jgi:hypothetical protein
MMKFDPGSFSDISTSPFAEKLWVFLNSEKSLACLETTTFLQRPALEGLQPLIRREFDNTPELAQDRYKQLMGRMVRQIMENRGYGLDRAGVRIRVGDIFASAARYKLLNQNHSKGEK